MADTSKYTCPKCGREITNSGAYINHVAKCKITEQLIFAMCHEYTHNKLSTKDISKKYDIGRATVIRYLKKNDLLRSKFEAKKIADEKGRIGHSNETKQKMRDSRLKYMRENPDEDRQDLKEQYLTIPIKKMRNILIDEKIHENHLIIIEKCFLDHYIDFAFEHHKILIDIGKDKKSPEVKKKYKLLMSKEYGEWKVFSLDRDILKEENMTVLGSFLKQLKSLLDETIISDETSPVLPKSVKQTGFVIEKPIPELERDMKKIEREVFNGKTRRGLESDIRQRKVKRPPYEDLVKDVEQFGYKFTGQKYDVSDNSIRNWIKWYEKHDPKLNKKFKEKYSKDKKN